MIIEPLETARQILQTASAMADAAKSSDDATTATFCRQAARRLYWSARTVIERADSSDQIVVSLNAEAARLDRLLTDSVA